jgi:hypothetical protein
VTTPALKGSTGGSPVEVYPQPGTRQANSGLSLGLKTRPPKPEERRRPRRPRAQLCYILFHRTDEPEWRNWQTHQTQNLASGNTRGGSTPPSGTSRINNLERFIEPPIFQKVFWAAPPSPASLLFAATTTHIMPKMHLRATISICRKAALHLYSPLQATPPYL